MKFTSNKPAPEEKEPVAYLTLWGSLVFKSEALGTSVWIDHQDGEVRTDWKFDLDMAEQVFYEGDSVTITF